jgi:hypothetical protein
VVKNQFSFLTADDYTSLYFQRIYMVFEIYKCFYKNVGTLSQMEERFVAWFCGGDNSSFSGIFPKIRTRKRLRQKAAGKNIF